MNEPEEKTKIDRFFEAYAMMRKYQKDYFKNKMIPDLQKAKQKLFLELKSEVRPPDAVQDVLL